MRYETIKSGKDLIVKFKNAEEYLDVLKKILELDNDEDVPKSNLAPLPEEKTEVEEMKEISSLQNNEKLDFLKHLTGVEKDIFLSEINKKGLTEKSFFLGKSPEVIDELYLLIKEYQELF